MIMMPYRSPGHRRSSQARQTSGTPQVVDAARTADGIEVDVAAILHRPFMQAFAADAGAVLQRLVGPGHEPIGGDGHVENGCGHGVSLPVVVDLRLAWSERGVDWADDQRACS